MPSPNKVGNEAPKFERVFVDEVPPRSIEVGCYIQQFIMPDCQEIAIQLKEIYKNQTQQEKGEKVPAGKVRIIDQYPADPNVKGDPTTEIYRDVSVQEFIKDPNGEFAHFGDEKTRAKLVMENLDRKIYNIIMPEEIVVSEIEIKSE